MQTKLNNEYLFKNQLDILNISWLSSIRKKVFYFMAYPNRSHGIRENNAYPHVAMMFTDFLRKNCLPGGK